MWSNCFAQLKPYSKPYWITNSFAYWTTNQLSNYKPYWSTNQFSYWITNFWTNRLSHRCPQ